MITLQIITNLRFPKITILLWETIEISLQILGVGAQFPLGTLKGRPYLFGFRYLFLGHGVKMSKSLGNFDLGELEK
jgi:hypothetical protein